MLLQQSIKELEHHAMFQPVINDIRSLVEIINRIEIQFKHLLFKNNTNSSIIMTKSSETSSETESKQLSNEIEELNIGNLIPLSCGHNGNYNESEVLFIKNELEKANFI